MIKAIFDLDGTLCTGHVTRGITLHHRTCRVNRLPLYAFLVAHLPLWWLQRAGMLSKERMNRRWARDLGWTVRGLSLERAAAAFAWIAEHYVAPRLRSDVVARLRQHQTAGHRVILVSGTPAPLLAAIGRHLGIDETVGTPLIVKNGRYTGACETPVCQGGHKGTRLAAYLGEAEDARWPHSYAYADSYTDIPLLERVGHPVAVYPDARLAAHARAQGWDVIGQGAFAS